VRVWSFAVCLAGAFGLEYHYITNRESSSVVCICFVVAEAEGEPSVIQQFRPVGADLPFSVEFVVR
jgi:hypothetical protein